MPDQNERREHLSCLDPVVANIFNKYPTTFCFAQGTSILPALFFPNLFIIVLPLAGYSGLGIMYYTIKHSQMSPSTVRLQLMFLRSLIYQTICLAIFLVIPGALCLVGTPFGLRNNPRISVYSFFLFLMHTPIDCVLILYSIKPYRHFIMEKIMSKKLIKMVETTTTNTQRGSFNHPSQPKPLSTVAIVK